jgi:hypothetical protein
MKFRIKVEETNGGKLEYTPQVKFNWWDWWWENIMYEGYGEHYFTTIMAIDIYDSEERAMVAIDKYKTCIQEKTKNKIKTTKYINI